MSEEEFWFWINSHVELWHVWGYKIVDWENDCYDLCR